MTTWRDAGPKANYEISDTIAWGLRLRIQPRGPTYFRRVQYQGAEHRIRIGRIDAWGLAHARTACPAIVRHISTGNGVPSEEWIELQHQALAAVNVRRKGKTDVAIPYVPEVMPR